MVYLTRSITEVGSRLFSSYYCEKMTYSSSEYVKLSLYLFFWLSNQLLNGNCYKHLKNDGTKQIIISLKHCNV